MEDEHGIPTAPLVTARFADFVERDARARGNFLRFGHPPYPVVGMSRDVLRQYIEGPDPITSKPLMQEILDALTVPLTEREKHPTIVRKVRRPRWLAADTEENLYRTFVENGWTDGLPIVLPTEERVAEMLTGTDHAPDEIVGRMIITTHQEKMEYTVEKVAGIAVMAGARPEHFPVILALAASQEPSMPSSTTSWGRMMVVNGPIRNEIGMNCGTAALSPFNLANSVIGRAWTLMSINFGDARAGENFMATFGHNLNYNNMCFGENEEISVFEPFHVQKGFRPDESVVSLFRGWNVLNFGIGPAEGDGSRDRHVWLHGAEHHVCGRSAGGEKSAHRGLQNQAGSLQMDRGEFKSSRGALLGKPGAVGFREGTGSPGRRAVSPPGPSCRRTR